MVEMIEFSRLFDFSTRGSRVEMVDIIEFFRLFDLGGRVQSSNLVFFFDFLTWGEGLSLNGRF